MAKATKRKAQMQFTPTAELRQIIEAEAEERSLSVSAIIRTKMLKVYNDKIKAFKAQQQKTG